MKQKRQLNLTNITCIAFVSANSTNLFVWCINVFI